ncbi:MAG: hypothetical protein AAGD92_00935 [Pseudomonadota bacterium]
MARAPGQRFSAMNTPTHLIVALAALARKNNSARRNLAVAAGALAPDLSIFVFYFWAKIVRAMPEAQIWRDAYWREPWQTLGAVSNSVPLMAVLLVLSYWRRAPLLGVFALAGLIHVALDFPVHADDAHRHFWPLTQWRFHSPVSYWDPSHYGVIGGAIELLLLIGTAFVLWVRFTSLWVRVALALTVASYFFVGVYFRIAFAA